jgi:hypothetical protein
MSDFFNRLPLHLACLNQAPVEVVTALLKAHPDGEVAWLDGSGKSGRFCGVWFAFVSKV